ncbi:hypothetical protein [Micromonospora sp. I033]
MEPVPEHDVECEGDAEISVGDPVLGKSRLLSRRCDTCVFAPGNRMHLAPGRLRDLVTEARQREAFIVCPSNTAALRSAKGRAGNLSRVRRPLPHPIAATDRTALRLCRGRPATISRDQTRGRALTAVELRDPVSPATQGYRLSVQARCGYRGADQCSVMGSSFR